MQMEEDLVVHADVEICSAEEGPFLENGEPNLFWKAVDIDWLRHNEPRFIGLPPASSSRMELQPSLCMRSSCSKEEHGLNEETSICCPWAFRWTRFFEVDKNLELLRDNLPLYKSFSQPSHSRSLAHAIAAHKRPVPHFSLQHLRFLRQDSDLWCSLHDGALTTGGLADFLGLKEMGAAGFLRIKGKGMVSGRGSGTMS